jgi:hypothetical protein
MYGLCISEEEKKGTKGMNENKKNHTRTSNLFSNCSHLLRLGPPASPARTTSHPSRSGDIMFAEMAADQMSCVLLSQSFTEYCGGQFRLRIMPTEISSGICRRHRTPLHDLPESRKIEALGLVQTYRLQPIQR